MTSKNEAKNYFKQAREKVLKDISVKKEALDKEIDEEVNKAEIEIKTFRDNAPEKNQEDCRRDFFRLTTRVDRS